MHHDAITGTHEYPTEISYYKTLDKALEFISKAKELFRGSGEENFKFSEVSIILNTTEYISNILVNPSAIDRDEVMNITLPQTNENIEYVIILETAKNNTNIKGYVTEIDEIDENTKELTKVRKLFFRLKMDKLSTARLYILMTKDAKNCKKYGITCSVFIQRELIEKPHQIGNGKINLDFNDKGSLTKISQIYNESAYQDFPIEERITYYRTDGKSRSGHYIFNPIEKEEVFKTMLQKKYHYKLGDLITIFQVHEVAKNAQILKTYSVNQQGNQKLLEEYAMQIEFFSKDTIEASLSLKLSEKSGKSFTAYADDSMKLIERPIYHKNVDIMRHNNIELTGYFTYA